MSTARGGENSAFEPGLEHLIGALTASGHPHELAGRDAARAAFRMASQQPAQTEPTGSGWTRSGLARSASARSTSTVPPRRRRSSRIALPARLAVSVAAVIAVLGGLTAAAAAQALPPQVQQIAYNVLSPLGVPVSQPAHSHHVRSASPGRPSSATGPAAGHGGCPCPSASPQNTGTGPQHHPAPKPKPRAKAKTNKPRAKPVLRLVSGRLNDRLIVVAAAGKPGGIVNLTELTGGAWTKVASAPLGPKLRAVFILPVTTAAGHLFQVDVHEGASHADVASNRLWIPRRAKTGATAIQPSPSPSPTGTGSPTPTPTPTLTATTAPAGSPTLTGSPSPSAERDGEPHPHGRLRSDAHPGPVRLSGISPAANPATVSKRARVGPGRGMAVAPGYGWSGGRLAMDRPQGMTTRRNQGSQAAPPAAMPTPSQTASSSALAAVQVSQVSIWRGSIAPSPRRLRPGPPRRRTEPGGAGRIPAAGSWYRSIAGRSVSRTSRSPTVLAANALSTRSLNSSAVQPADRVVLAQQRRGSLPVRVRGAHPRVTRHRHLHRGQSA